MTQINLGPKGYLHPGAHDTLISDPPTGISYCIFDPPQLMALHEEGKSLFSSFPLFDAIQAADDLDVIHSHRFPVLGSSKWIVDADDLVIPLLCGRHIINESFRQSLAARDPATRVLIGRRIRNMMTAYLHSSCCAILLRSQGAVQQACRFLLSYEAGLFIRPLLAKVKVIYPSQAAISQDALNSKWATGSKPSIIFCGKDYSVKNGHVALEVMARLTRQHSDVRFIYIGQIPAEERSRFHSVLRKVTWYESMPHPDVLAIFKDSHILFHPSRSEALGVVFLEAMAAGMAVVAGGGSGMEHITELFPNVGAALIRRSSGVGSDESLSSDESLLFESALTKLLGEWSFAEVLGRMNHSRASTGSLSIAHRNEQLLKIYDDDSSADPLNISELPDVGSETILQKSRDSMYDDERSYRATVPCMDQHIFVKL